jgi:LacI family transcriptional regulator
MRSNTGKCNLDAARPWIIIAQLSLEMKQKRILIEFGLPYFQQARDRIRGILDYARRNCPDWEFISDPFDFFQTFQRGFYPVDKADGVFFTSYRPSATTDKLAQKEMPAVNMTLPDEPLPFPVVCVDDLALGRAAAEHLSLPVVTETLFIGPESVRSNLRLQGFTESLEKLGRKPPHALLEKEAEGKKTIFLRMKHIKTHLRQLRQQSPSRLAVFAYSDSFGHAVTKACSELGLAVPNSVSIIGCDNEELICSLSSVPLSSIPLNSFKIGQIAAEKLHLLMQGKRVPPLTLVEPLRPVERLSSSHLQVDDPVVAKALSIIQDKACTGLRVYEMLDYLPISRRSLETRFRKALGRSPHEEIDRVRIDLAFGRLKADDGSNAKIAIECGFSSATHFEQAFKKHTGHQPSHYRP